MEDYPQTQIEFADRFSSEQACRDYLIKMRWPNGFICPGCGHNNAWLIKRDQLYCIKCNLQTSSTAGTIFHRTKKPLRLWFQAMWQITSQKYGGNALGLQRVLGLGSYHTAWEWLHKLRRAMVRPNREPLSGLVEVDETYVGGVKPGKRGRGAKRKPLVLIGVEDKSELGYGRIRLRQMPDASAASLRKFIKDNIESGSTVRTDGWTGYNSVPSWRYKHHIEIQSANIGEYSLALVHQVASLLKRWLNGTYRGQFKHHI